jgi:hypothetical protein
VCVRKEFIDGRWDTAHSLFAIKSKCKQEANRRNNQSAEDERSPETRGGENGSDSTDRRSKRILGRNGATIQGKCKVSTHRSITALQTEQVLTSVLCLPRAHWEQAKTTADDAPTRPPAAVANITTNGAAESSKPPPNLGAHQPMICSPSTTAMMANYEKTCRDIDMAQRELNLLAQQQQQLLMFARQQQQQQMAAFVPPPFVGQGSAGGGPGFPFEPLHAAQQRGLPNSLESMAALQAQQQHFARMSGHMGFPQPMDTPFLARRQYGVAAPAGFDPTFPTSSSSSAAAMMAAASGRMGKQPSDKATSSQQGGGPIMIMKQKPKRPLSAYNLFFKDQRAKMNEELAYAEERGGEEKKDDDDEPEVADQKSGDKHKMAASKGGGKKPKKSKVGFAVLAKTIGPLWKTLDKKTLAFYQAQADQEKERYRQECTAFQRYQERTWETQQKSLEATIDDSAKKRYLSSSTSSK